jgi:DUF4097 and DUF4098 domain-containing protein YvlB
VFQKIVVPVVGNPSLRLSLASGNIRATAEDRDNFLIDGKGAHIVGAEIDDEGVVNVAVAGGSGSVDLTVPTGADLVLGTQSGRITLKGEFGAVQITTESGSISVDRCDRADLRTGTGTISVAECDGEVRALSRSGKVSLGRTQSAEVATMSSSIDVDSNGPVRAKTTSGHISVRAHEACNVSAKSISGSIEVHLPPGVRPETLIRTASGRQHVSCEPGDDCRVALSTVSGSMRVDNV